MAEKTNEGPRVGGFSIEAIRRGSQSDLFSSLSILSFLELVAEKEVVVAINVESRDIQKNPYLFSIAYFHPAKIEVLYSYVPGMSPKKRRLDIIKYFFNILTLVQSAYSVDSKQIYQLLDSALNDMNEYVTGDYDKLYSFYDNLKNEVKLLQKKVSDLAESNMQLARENYDLKLLNDEYKLRLKQLETYSDEVLKVKIQEWLNEHNGEINVSDFARVHGVSENRVELMLNKLVTDGFISLKQ
ncbi:hypothetical protein FJZ26_01815 [Candidatus Parvarchaeota archaeon]|nr:hypothetical protein [Candidatus Parvarchaeota archaeon]